MPPRALRAIVIGVAVVAALAVAVVLLARGRSANPNVVRASGRIEGYETQIGPKVAGRVTYIAVREGALVRRGELLLRTTDLTRNAQLRQATAQVAAADRNVAQAEANRRALESQLHEATLSERQAGIDAGGRIAQARGQLAAAEAQLAQSAADVAQARANAEIAGVDFARAKALVASGDVSQDNFDHARSAYETARAALAARRAAQAAAARQVQAARGTLQLAESAALNPPIRASQTTQLQRRIAQARDQTAMAQADAIAARAQRDAVASNVSDLRVFSPLDGVVTVRAAEPGAIVAEGAPVLTILDPKSVYLRAFVPEGQIGRVRVGNRASVYLDSAPKVPVAARVSAIDAQASFTPENVYFREDRVRQVFGVRLAIDDPQGNAKPGMPADADIELSPAGR
ncbi:MAG: HlyD family efflux transporter periplasmic adaptor subunit [Candidatus Eremiobacteraeota bacterium]|nr:HlyD family efflux transporter periplasmic adaptor subunit [Candidatus Eremiobacteraeota bacterium]